MELRGWNTNTIHVHVCAPMTCTHTTLRQKWGGDIYSNIYYFWAILYSPMLCVRSTITMTAAAFQKNYSFAECLLQEITGACVDTKLRCIEVTRIISGGRGWSCISSYRGGYLFEGVYCRDLMGYTMISTFTKHVGSKFTGPVFDHPRVN